MAFESRAEITVPICEMEALERASADARGTRASWPGKTRTVPFGARCWRGRRGAEVSNPFNPEAGSTAAPASAREREWVERSAAVIWRAFPYFAWRYAARGRAFGRSDAGYLVTLLAQNEATSRAQVYWLAGVLAPRGMPSLLLEYQLESLGRIGRREELPGAERFLALAAEWRSARLSAHHSEALITWLTDTVRDDAAWTLACRAASDVAKRALRVASSGVS